MMAQAQHISAFHQNAKELNKILVVDDEPDINTIAKIALESFGKFNVETCSSGLEALKKAEWFEPNLILLDVMMPFMDGEETLRKLKRNPKTEDIPVIFVTAKIFNRDISKYKQLGALDVIPKPFDPVVLPKQVRAIWSDFQVHEDAEREIREKLRTMKGEFVVSMQTRLPALRARWSEFLEEESKRSLMTMYEVVHKIVGVSGTVQHNEIYEASLQIEQLLTTRLESDIYTLSSEEKERITALIGEIASFVPSTEYIS